MEFVLFFLMIVTMLGLIVVKFLEITWAYVWVKGLASLFFIATGIASYHKAKYNKKYFILILLGLIFSFAGDIFLELRNIISISFILGVGSFALCHIIYSAGFCYLKKVTLRDIYVCFAIAIPMIMLQSLGSFSYNGMRYIVMGYTVVISFMVSKAISLHCYYQGNEKVVIMTITGSIMFLVSDVLLLFCFFGTSTYKVIPFISTIFYYSGQGVLALSLSKKLDTVHTIKEKTLINK